LIALIARLSTHSTGLLAMTSKTTNPNLEEPKFGFHGYAERLNGRAAMIGFIIALAIEYTSGQGVLAWLGLL
jgi:hypothetical protein